MGSIAGSNIEWQFLIAGKITFNKAVPCADRIKAIYAAHTFEPAFSNRYICNLITHDDAKRICHFLITNQFQPVNPVAAGCQAQAWCLSTRQSFCRAAVAFCRASEMPSTSHIAPLSVFFDVSGIIRALSISPEHRPHDRQPLPLAIRRQSCHHYR